MDPARWSSDEMTELERQLLEAARAERAPEGLSAHMAAALEGGRASLTSIGGGNGISATAGKVVAPLFGKAGLWGALSLGLAAAASWYAADAAPTQAPAATTAPSAPAASDPTTSAPSAPSAPSTPAIAAEAPRATDPGRPGAAATAPVVDDADGMHGVDGDALRDEVALLARARQALQAHDAGRAMRLLDRHRQRFPGGTLAPEASALRIEALVQREAHAEAAAEAERFVASYPGHPLQARIEKVR